MQTIKQPEQPQRADFATAQVRFLRAVDRLISAADDARAERERVLALLNPMPAEGQR